jgi:hypothetical protein
MTVLLDLPPEMESKMQELAQAEGLDVSALVRETMAARLRQYNPAEPLTEADLLARINRGFPEAFWDRYRHLIAKRRAETMTSEEQQEVIGMSDQLEAWWVERLQYLIKLAEIRHTSVDALAHEMGLHPTQVE